MIDEADRILVDAIASLADAPEMMIKGADFRSDGSIKESRWAEINKWLERSVFEPVTREEARASGGKIFGARWVDDPVKEKSRYVIQDFAKTKVPTVFAAASDMSTARVVDYKAVRCGYPTFVFDVTSAYTHAVEKDLVYFEPPWEWVEKHGECLWWSRMKVYGRRDGARSWQDHFVDLTKSEVAKAAGFTVRQCPKAPTIFYIEEFDGVLALHVDDGHGTGDPAGARKFMLFLEKHLEMKWVDGLHEGDSYEYFELPR